MRRIRLATRGLIFKNDKLLLVNAWPDGKSDLMCAPGGGAELHQSLPENLAREVLEETGLTVAVGACVLINEFHDPDGDFHQVDIYFRCTVVVGETSEDWKDPEGVVTDRRWVTRAELATLRVKPDSLADVAWDHDERAAYDLLEPILR